jgi:DNA-binding GntR family transcriptional regulator
MSYIGSSDRTSLPETVYRELRGAIVNGTFQPGQMLRQEQIARKLGVSRAPLREALPRLEADGMVVLHPRRGYSVVGLNASEIKEIFDLRALVEQEAARAAGKMRNEADVSRVRALQEELLKEVDVSKPAEITRWFEIHTKFHESLLAPSQLRHFMRMAASLRTIVEPYIRVEIVLTGGLSQSQEEHFGLCNAFAKGDGDLLALLTRQHCDHTAARLLEGLARTKKR